MKLVAQFTIVFSLLSAFVYSAYGELKPERMSYETHTTVIQKLHSAIKGLKVEPKRQLFLYQRIGDLYSERARITEAAPECKTCKTPRADRKTSLTYYHKSYKLAQKHKYNLSAEFLIQYAHTSQVLNQNTRAGRLYKKIIAQKHRYNKTSVGLAHLKLGEVLYTKGQYKNSLKNFNKAARYKIKNQSAFIKYHQAWCHFHLGHERTAQKIMTRILLQKPDDKIDQKYTARSYFQELASKDLATFYARGKFNNESLQAYYRLTPEKERLKQLEYLAKEFERLGSPRNSIRVWQFYLGKQEDSLKRISSYIHIAKSQYQHAYYKAALKTLQQSQAYWSESYCSSDETCTREVKKTWRTTLTNWTAQQKKTPSVILLKAYKTYTSTFPEDLPILYLQAQLGMKTHRYKTAFKTFKQTQELAAEQISAASKKSPALRRTFVGSIVGQIDAAESLSNVDLQKEAYANYLEHLPNTQRAHTIRYQVAQLYYKTKRYDDAAELFASISLNKRFKNRSLRLKAAHLALDSLALLKEDNKIIALSKKYQRVFSVQAAEFISISRKARLNRTAKATADNDLSDEDIRVEIANLDRVNLRGATKTEKITVYKNQMALSEQLKDLKQAHRHGNQLLRVKGLSARDRRWVIQKQIFYAEMTLNFRKALQLKQKLVRTRRANLKDLLSLAVLTELSGQNPTGYYQTFIRKTPSRREANEVRAQLVLRSRKPWQALARYKKQFASTPELFAQTLLEVYSRTTNKRQAKRFLNQYTGLKKRVSGKQVVRALHYPTFYAFKNKIRKHRIRRYSQKSIQQSLLKRITYLKEGERLTNEAVRKQDWILKISYLTLMKNQYQKLYKEINALPAPRNLKKKDLRRYKKNVAAQTQTYKNSATALKVKLKKLWNNSANLDFYVNRYNEAPYTLKKMHRKDIYALSAAAKVGPSGFFTKRRLNNLISDPVKSVTRSQFAAAKRNLARSPYDLDNAKVLKDMANNRGNYVFSAYMDDRIKQLKNIELVGAR